MEINATKDQLSDCIKEKLGEGWDHDQAVAACLNMYEAESPKGGGAPEDVEIKQAPTFEVKAVDFGERTIEGYAATFDEDQIGDIIVKGAFEKTIRERYQAGKVKVLRDHMDPIGVPTEMYEDGKGLYVKAKIAQTPLGDETLTLAKEGVLTAMSIGFMIPRGKSDWSDDMEIRYIREVKLYEFSIVTFPANEEAVLTGIKNAATMTPGSRGNHTSNEALTSGDEEAGEPHSEKSDPSVDELAQSLKEMTDFARLRLF